MPDPWSILGLSPDTADEKQVRGAYAKLLKVHRPDQDPEGFQRLRTAYDQALNWLKYRAASEEDDQADDWEELEQEEPGEQPPAASDAAPLAPAPLPSSWADGEVPFLPHKLGETPPQEQSQRKKPQRPERHWPREWSFALEALDRALQNPRRYLDVVTMALRALAVDVIECGIPPDALECILSDAFEADAGLFGMTAPVAILTQLLQGGRTAFLDKAIQALEQAGSPAHLTNLMQKIVECEVDVWSARTTDLFFRAAGLVAADRPFLAQSMMRKLHGFLDASAYSARFASLETCITRGMALRDLPPEFRSFWVRRLEHPESVCDWKAEDAAQALYAVVLQGPEWVGLPLVKDVVPADVWANAWKYRWVQVAMFHLIKLGNPHNLRTAGLAVVGIGLLIVGAHMATQLTPSTKRVPIKVEKTRYEVERENSQRKQLLIKKLQEAQVKQGQPEKK